jgi:PAS domain S-box-containing protein
VTVEHDDIRQRENLLRLLVENVRDYAIFVLDAKGRVATWNAGASRIQGYDATEIIGKHFSIFYPPEDIAAGKCELELATATKAGSFEEEGWRLRKDGSRFWANVVITSLRNDSNEVIGFAKVTRDLTDRRKNEEERLALARAQESDRSKDEFLAIIGHELRNPLAPMMTAVHLLGEKDRAKGEYKPEIDILQRQLSQLTRLVDDLMDVAATLRDIVKIDLRPVEVGAVIKRAVEVSSALIEKHDHTLKIEVPKSGLPVNVDVERMTQVFGNLLNNAAKYTDEGGTIIVRAFREGRDVVVSVEDNGRGIERRNLGRIFDLFTQGERSLDRHGSGLGVGLAVAKDFVKKHGGAISAQSDGPGTGARFVVRLPRSNMLETPLPFPVLAAPQSIEQAMRRVVLIDDNEDGAMLLGEALRRLGHQVEVANDGPTGLGLVITFRPDIVFLDIGLPGLNGYEVIRELRQDPAMSDLPIYAVTGYVNAAHKTEALRAGFTGHLPKPVTIESLQLLLAHSPRRTK